MERAERFMNLYYTTVPQIEIEARIAEITTSDVTDTGDGTTATFQNGTVTCDTGGVCSQS